MSKRKNNGKTKLLTSPINFVHINDLKFNKSSVEEDRKKKSKRGYSKHKASQYNNEG